MEKQKKKVIRFYTSLMAERDWLERMSEEGWFLTDIAGGFLYTFEQREPRRMVYDTEVFWLPKNPSRREIEGKAALMEMAEETGWEIAAHDETMNHYLRKPWEPDGTNELYDTEEERSLRGSRYRNMFTEQLSLLYKVDFWIIIMGILYSRISFGPLSTFMVWFAALYSLMVLGMAIYGNYAGNLITREASLSMEEWRRKTDRSNQVVKRRICITVKSLEKYLEKQAAQGLHIKNMRVIRYTFTKGEPGEYRYMMDTKHLVNRRRKKSGENQFKDKRDMMGINNDWQSFSLGEAEEAGWEFVGAVESRNILYRAKKELELKDLNEGKGIRFKSAFGGIAVMLILSGLAGGIIGFCMGYFM